MNALTKKFTASGIASGPYTKSIKQSYVQTSTKPPHPAVVDRIEQYKLFNATPKGIVLVYTDVVVTHDIPIGTPDVLVAVLDITIPSDYSWHHVEDLPVDLYTAGKSGCIERSMINELLYYGAFDVNLFQIKSGEILSPLLYSAKEPLRVAA